MQKHVISVGFDIPGEVNECVDFTSDSSLLDADIVVFSPNLEGYTVFETIRDRAFSARSPRDAFRSTQRIGRENYASLLKQARPSL